MFMCVYSWLKCVGTWLPDASLVHWWELMPNGTEVFDVFLSLMWHFWWDPASLSELWSFPMYSTQQCRSLFLHLCTSAPLVWEEGRFRCKKVACWKPRKGGSWAACNILWIDCIHTWLQPHCCRWVTEITQEQFGGGWGIGLSRDCCSQQYVQKCQGKECYFAMEILVFNPFNQPL